MNHVFMFDNGNDGRCMFCDCRPFGIHSSHPCTESNSCEQYHQ